MFAKNIEIEQDFKNIKVTKLSRESLKNTHKDTKHQITVNFEPDSIKQEAVSEVFKTYNVPIKVESVVELDIIKTEHFVQDGLVFDSVCDTKANDDLYANHEVKEDIVVGPTELHQPMPVQFNNNVKRPKKLFGKNINIEQDLKKIEVTKLSRDSLKNRNEDTKQQITVKFEPDSIKQEAVSEIFETYNVPIAVESAVELDIIKTEHFVQDGLVFNSVYDTKANDDLYANHEVKEDIVVGPTELHQPMPVQFNNNENCAVDNYQNSNINIVGQPTEHSKKLWCKVCHSVFFNKHDLRKHSLKHDAQNENACKYCTETTGKQISDTNSGQECEIACYLCSKEFLKKSCLVYHFYTMHVEKTDNGLSSKCYCECCRLLLFNPKQFLIHTKWHSFGLTNDRRLELAKEKLLSVKTKDLEEQFPCKDCNKVFDKSSSLKYQRYNKRKKLDSNEDQENVVQCRASQNLANVQLKQNQFLTQQLRIYEESHECITPNVNLHRNTDIPGDGNCLFHSLISVLQLQISTYDLRRQLRDSPYLNSCHNPQEAYNILSSNNEYGDLDCLYLFAKIYKQNICVHYHYFNVISKNEDTRFCHFIANYTHNWIHLDLRELHFTPFFSDDEKKKEDERKQKQKNKEYSKRYRDKKRTSNLQTSPSTGGVPYVPSVNFEQSASINEKNDEEIAKENKKRERNREYQRAWRQRQKDLKKKYLKKKVSKEEKEEKRRKRNRENQRAYYQRKKGLKENDKNVEELFQKKLDDLQMKRKKLDSNEELSIYEASHECVTPKVILHRNTDIPDDSNCLFHSLIRVLQLQISTCDLRKQLRDSPYLNSCHNPQEAYNILSSNNEYGDLDCLYLFAKIYNQNICLHYHYFNVISKTEDTRFCHFKANETHNWIHLDRRDLHFTPYFSDDEKKKEDERKRKQKNKEYSKRYRDKKRASNLQTGPSARDVLDVQPVIHTSQIAGPSTGGVPYVPPVICSS